MSSRLEFEIVRDAGELAGLAGPWNRLADRQGSPLLRHEWFAAAADSLCAPGALRVVLGYRDGELAAIAPLALVQGQSGRRLEILGMSPLREPSDLLFADEAALRALLDQLVALGEPLALERMPRDGAVARLLPAALRRRGALVSRDTSGSRYIEIRGSWEDYLAALSSRRRYDLRRARKRSGGEAQIRARLSYPSPEELPEVLERAFRIEAASWKGRHNTALRDNPRMKRFFEHYGRAMTRQGMLQVGFLDIGDETCAMQISVESHRRLWVLKVGYDESYARCSPGIQLMMSALQHAFERGLDGYELLGSDESWLQPWAPHTHHYSALVGYPLTLRGISAVTADAVRVAGGRLRRGVDQILKQPADGHARSS